MVGRILARLAPHAVSCGSRSVRRISVHQRRWQRPYAIRKPADWPVERPGDLVELDTLDIRPPSDHLSLKQFTARDVVSRWDTLELRRDATGPGGSRCARSPWPSGCPSRSGPSASTTARSSWPTSRAPVRPAASACSSCHPRSPKLHGAVERANRTHTEEFYEVTDAPWDLRPALALGAIGQGGYSCHRAYSFGARTPEVVRPLARESPQDTLRH